MRLKMIIINSLLMLIIIGCKSTNEIDRLNFQKWKDDSFGCKNDREFFCDSILKYKECFIGLDSIDIKKYLVKPDLRYSNNNYAYYIAPNYHCDIANIDSGAVILIVEFDWLNRATNLAKAAEW